jgi:hypothetical protein
MVKPLIEFTKCKTCSNGVRNACKSCTRKYMIKYQSDNLDKITEYHKNYKLINAEKNKEYLTNYNTKPETKLKKRKYYEENVQYYRDLEKTEKRKKYRYNYNKNSHTLKWRLFLNGTLKRLGKNKEGKTIDLLGYSALELKEHLESLFTEGMTWNNYGEWHIDHIRPVSSFNKNTPVKVVNALNNLQPLWATTREINGVIYKGNLNKYNN